MAKKNIPVMTLQEFADMYNASDCWDAEYERIIRKAKWVWKDDKNIIDPVNKLRLNFGKDEVATIHKVKSV